MPDSYDYLIFIIMDKNSIKQKLRAAKKSHITWVSYAEAMYVGMPYDSSKVTPIIPTECEFGEWYYGDGQELNTLQAFKDLELPHINLHDLYMKVCKLNYEPINVGLFGILRNKATSERKEKLSALMRELKIWSKEMLSLLTELDMDISQETTASVQTYTTIESGEKKPKKLNGNRSILAEELSTISKEEG